MRSMRLLLLLFVVVLAVPTSALARERNVTFDRTAQAGRLMDVAYEVWGEILPCDREGMRVVWVEKDERPATVGEHAGGWFDPNYSELNCTAFIMLGWENRPWRVRCSIGLHEFGHAGLTAAMRLAGVPITQENLAQQHSNDPASLMYPTPMYMYDPYDGWSGTAEQCANRGRTFLGLDNDPQIARKTGVLR